MNDSQSHLASLLPPSLRGRAWLRGLSVRSRDLAPGLPIYRAGDTPQRLFFIASGWVGLSTHLSSDEPRLQDICLPGDVIGGGFLYRPNLIEHAFALSGASLLSVPLGEIQDALQEDPDLRSYMNTELARSHNALQALAAVIGKMKAPERLAFFLLYLFAKNRAAMAIQNDPFASTLSPTLSLPITQTEIGQMLGLTNVSVNRAFRQLEMAQLIQTGRQIVTVLDEAGLAQRLGLLGSPTLIDRLTQRSDF